MATRTTSGPVSQGYRGLIIAAFSLALVAVVAFAAVGVMRWQDDDASSVSTSPPAQIAPAVVNEGAPARGGIGESLAEPTLTNDGVSPRGGIAEQLAEQRAPVSVPPLSDCLAEIHPAAC